MQALGDGSSVKTVLLFDMDGTLVRSGAGNTVHKDSFAVGLKEVYGVSGAAITQVEHAGRTDQWIARELLKQHGINDENIIEPGLSKCYAVMAEYCREHRADIAANLALCEGVPQLLQAVCNRADVLCGLVTGNLSRICMTKLVSVGLDRYGLFACGGFGEASAHRPDLVRAAMASARAKLPALPPTEHLNIFVIGDTPHDLHAAAHSGLGPTCRAVGVCTGEYTAAELLAACAPGDPTEGAAPGLEGHAPRAILPDLADTAAVLACLGIQPL